MENACSSGRDAAQVNVSQQARTVHWAGSPASLASWSSEPSTSACSRWPDPAGNGRRGSRRPPACWRRVRTGGHHVVGHAVELLRALRLHDAVQKLVALLVVPWREDGTVPVPEKRGLPLLTFDAGHFLGTCEDPGETQLRTCSCTLAGARPLPRPFPHPCPSVRLACFRGAAACNSSNASGSFSRVQLVRCASPNEHQTFEEGL